MNKKFKVTLVIGVILVAIAVTTGILIATFSKNFYTDKYPITKSQSIELPGHCKYIDAGGMGVAKFEIDKSVNEVTEFYNNYLKKFKKVKSPHSEDIGYLIEPDGFVISKYEVLSNGNKTIFNIYYDIVITSWSTIN